MFGSILRVLLGFALACLTAGVVQVLFALTPAWLIAADQQQLLRSLEWVLLTATHTAVFSAPFALVAAAIGEWQSLRVMIYYLLAGVLIAVGGFVAQYQAEVSGQPSIANPYAIGAYLVTGLLAGWVFWLVSGRHAGDDELDGVAPARAVSAGLAGSEPPAAGKAPPATTAPAAATPAATPAAAASAAALPAAPDSPPAKAPVAPTPTAPTSVPGAAPPGRAVAPGAALQPQLQPQPTRPQPATPGGTTVAVPAPGTATAVPAVPAGAAAGARPVSPTPARVPGVAPPGPPAPLPPKKS